MDRTKTIALITGIVLVIGVTWLFTGSADLSVLGGRTVINIWHPWGGTSGIDFRNLVDRYNEQQDKVFVRPLFVPNNLSSNQKFFLAVKARRPPEVIFVDGPQVAEWAEHGVLEELDTFIEQAGIKEEDFWAPCWRENFYKGHTYAMTFCADPNFAFGWNKKVFREAGLDPEKPPRTLAELDEMDAQITHFEQGSMVRIGIIPWAVYGGANSIFTWGWAFGGDFFNYESNLITADHPRVVDAMEWMLGYSRKYGIERVSGLQQTFGTGEQNPFYTGKLAMTPLHITELRNIKNYAPKLEFGLTTLPQPEGGEKDSSWVGGWCVGLPRNGAHRELAWEFVRWMCATEEGTIGVEETTGSFPGYKHSPIYDAARRDPHKAVFLQVLEAAKHQRPVMPAQAYFMGELERAVDEAMREKLSPAEALHRAGEEAQKALNRTLTRKKPIVEKEQAEVKPEPVLEKES